MSLFNSYKTLLTITKWLCFIFMIGRLWPKAAGHQIPISAP